MIILFLYFLLKMYDRRLSSTENFNNYVHYLNNNVHDKEAEQRNKNFRYFMYFLGAILIIKILKEK